MKLRLIYIGLIAMLLTACTAVTDDVTDIEVPEVSKRYINLSIAVINNNSPVTRGTPLGGEDGNGREAGFDRENAVTGITLILYQDANGINTSANPTIDFVAYYPVTSTTKDENNRIEATYQTGNQLVPPNAIDFTKPYRAIVVANADLTSSITAGTSKLNNLRDMKLSKIYSGDETKAATACGNFVMSSEQDQTLNFSASGIRTQDAAGDYYYDLTAQPLTIERMAARIDFWAVNGTYNDSKRGYVYSVTGSNTDKFVVTGIMPFNLNNGTNIAETNFGKEYLLKRLTASLSTITPQWLIDETTTNYVLDPQTSSKVTAATPLLTNSLQNVKDLEASAFTANSYYKSVTAMHGTIANGGGYASLTDKFTSGSDDPSLTGEDVIVAYPMENTLLPESYLYYHATGIAIEGYYYAGGLTDESPKRLVYYGYLRHQGEGTTYDITTSNNVEELPSTSVAMNFGIVRNNIYRIYISGIEVVEGTIKLNIEEKHWRHVDNPTIYI